MSNLSSHNPITMYETISGNTELTQNPPQAAGQTFYRGTPVSLNNTGFTEAWSGTINTGSSPTGPIYGISLENAGNLGVSGEGYPANFGQQGPPWANITVGPPPNQPNAVTIPYGAPFLTGGTLTMLANQDTLFTAQTDTSEGASVITAGVVTLVSGVYVFTATASSSNVHYAGEVILLSGFTGAGAPLNGQYATVTGTPTDAAYTADLTSTYTGGAIGATGAGADNPGPVSPSIANVGLAYGLTLDSTGYWYIDFNKRTVGANACVVIVALYPGDVLQSTPFTEVPNGQLVFRFIPNQTFIG